MSKEPQTARKGRTRAKAKAKAKGKKYRRPSDAERRRIVAELELERCKGRADHDLIPEFAAAKGVAEKTVRGYLAIADKNALRRTLKHRSNAFALQVQRLEHAMELALANTEPVTVWTKTREKGPGGKMRTVRVRETEWVQRPKIGPYLEALRQLARLQGLDAPQKLEIVHHHLRTVLSVVVEAIRVEVKDDATCQRLFQRLHSIAAQAEQEGDPNLSQFRGNAAAVRGVAP